MALKDIVKHNLRRFGLDVIRHPPALPLVHHLREFFAENRIDVVLDVGAYLGLYCRMLRCDVGYKDEIISFEPVSRSFAKLSEEMAEDRAWRGFNFGLSDNTRMVSLNTFGERGDFNSMLMLTEEASDAYPPPRREDLHGPLGEPCLHRDWRYEVDEQHKQDRDAPNPI